MEGIVQQIGDLKQSGGMFLLYFFNDNCAPCLSLRPKLDEMMRAEFPDVRILYVGNAAYPELSASHGVYSAPVIIVMADGREFRRFSKHISLSGLREVLERLQQLMGAHDGRERMSGDGE